MMQNEILLKNLFSLTLITFLYYREVTGNIENDVVVDTVNGKVRGSIDLSISGDEYFSFKGIPYAKPPVGELRFEVSVKD